MSLRQTLDGYAADAARVTFGQGVSAHPSWARKMIREALMGTGQRADDMTDEELKDFADKLIQALVQFSDVQGQELRRATAEGNFISCKHAEACDRLRREGT